MALPPRYGAGRKGSGSRTVGSAITAYVCPSVIARCGSGCKRSVVRTVVESCVVGFVALEARFGVGGGVGVGYAEVVLVRAVWRAGGYAFCVAGALTAPTANATRFAQTKVCCSLPTPKPSTSNPDHQSTKESKQKSLPDRQD